MVGVKANVQCFVVNDVCIGIADALIGVVMAGVKEPVGLLPPPAPPNKRLGIEETVSVESEANVVETVGAAIVALDGVMLTMALVIPLVILADVAELKEKSLRN